MQTAQAAGKPAGPAVPELRVLGERPLVAAAVYLMLGILAARYFPVRPDIGLLVLMAFLLFCMILVALKVNITLPLVIMSFICGYVLMSAAIPAWASDAGAPAGPVVIKGRIESVGLSRGGYTQYTIGEVTVGGSAVDGGALVTCKSGNTKGGEGDMLTAYAELDRPQPSLYYGGFNARAYYLRRGIRFTAFAVEPAISLSGRTGTILDLPRKARLYASALLNQYLGPDNAALIDALLSGNRSGISGDINDSFIALGVAHLLAVSGLNISLTAGAAWLLCRKLKLPMPVSLAVSFLVMVSYVLFAGFTPSVERAAVMWLVMMGGLVAARRYDPISSIAAAVVIILALNPLDLFDAGFQLSFAATAAMFLWLAPVMRQAPDRRFMKFFASAIGVTVCVTLLALPIILSCFNSVSLISPLANLVLVPASFVLQLAGTALLFTGFMPGVAELLGSMLNRFATIYLNNVKMLDWAALTLHAATPPEWLLAAYALLAIAVSPSLVRMKRAHRAAALAGLAVAAVLMLAPMPSTFTGHGDAAVVAEGSKALSLYWKVNGRSFAACGGGLAELAGYLKSRGVARLDGLYVLSAKPPKDGSALAGAGISADSLYVPDGWMEDPAAQAFLEQGLALGMEPRSAGSGPFEFFSDGGSELLVIPASGGRLAFAPWAPGGSAAVMEALGRADIIVVNAAAAKVEKPLQGLSPIALILPGDIAAGPRNAYNITECGSVEIAESGGRPSPVPWRNGWEDGLQGSFR